jgi:hypothetical protein
MRRLPFNLRPLLGVKKGLNPVTLGLAVQAFSYLACVYPEQSGLYLQRIEDCIARLELLVSKGYHGVCWGYNFDWQARYATVPAYTPTVVATGIITNALFTAFSLHGNKLAFELCESAAQFVLRDLGATEYPDGSFCWSYSPHDGQQVLNASMKGARLCAQVASINRNDECLQHAVGAVRFVASQQRENGAFPYAIQDTRIWSDNFHTAYVLDCLDEYEKLTGDVSFVDVTQKGWSYYRRSMFLENGTPKYYDYRVYPIDATACGQSLLTLCRFGDLEFAAQVAKFSLKCLQAERGYCYFRRHAFFTNRIPYMRWSSAWMFTGLSYFLLSSHDRKN